MGTTAPDSMGQTGLASASLRAGKNWAAWLQAIQPTESPSRPNAAPDLAATWTVLVHLARRTGFTVRRSECAAGAGFTTWRNRLIRISPGESQEQAVIALAHQLGHVLLHSRIAHLEPSGTVPCHGIRKVEADSVAYLVSLHLGIDPGPVMFPSVSNWAGTDPRARPEDTAQAVAVRVTGAAARITARLDDTLSPPIASWGDTQVASPGPRRTDRAGDARPDDRTDSGQASLLVEAAPVPRDELVRVHRDSARFFRDRLDRSWVPGYLAARGFGAEALGQWQVGYAAAGWAELTRHLREIGYRDEVIEAAGLGRRSTRGTLIDVFRDRAMLPIRSADGTVAGFIGRAGTDAGPGVPKYLNSPRTGLYDKGEALFGLWEAREALAGRARPVIVEGPLDAMAIRTTGESRYAAVAPCGTALTARHVAALQNVTGLETVGVLVAFDGDQAGRRAAVRAYHLLSPVTTRLEAVTFPLGQDPAQMLQDHGPAGLTAMLSEHTQPLADLVIDAELDRWSRWLRHAEGQVNALRAAAPLVAAMPPKHVARQVVRLADRLELDHATVTEAVTEALPQVIASADGAQNLRGPPTRAPHQTRQEFPYGLQQAPVDPLAAAPEERCPTQDARTPLPARYIPG
jgi:DNA primase